MERQKDVYKRQLPDWVDVQIIPVNGAARRGEPMKKVTDIAIHYVGNPGTTAQANRNYFAQPDTQVSAHFLVGLDGEVIQCIPLEEKSSATNERNRDTISIEVCHPDADVYKRQIIHVLPSPGSYLGTGVIKITLAFDKSGVLPVTFSPPHSFYQ